MWGHIQPAAAFALAGGLPERCLPGCVRAVRAGVPRAVGLRAASLGRTAAYEGTLPLCRFELSICFIVVLFGF